MDNVQESGDFWCGVLPHVPNKHTNLVLEVTAGETIIQFGVIFL